MTADLPVLDELGFYTLAGSPDSARELIDEVRDGEAAWFRQRLHLRALQPKESATLSGAAGAVSERITDLNRRDQPQHPPSDGDRGASRARCRASPAVASCSGSAAASLPMQDAYGISHITTAQLEDFAGLMRRLFRGEVDHRPRRPGGKIPRAAPRCRRSTSTCRWGSWRSARTPWSSAGRCFDEVVLHTYFTDETTARCVKTVKDAAERAGRDPDSVRVWSCFATVGDHIPYDKRLMKTVGRLGTYLQGYGELLVRTNGWDHAVLERFLADDVVSSVRGLDVVGTTEQLEHVATLIPAEWLAPSATGSPEQCVAAVRRPARAGLRRGHHARCEPGRARADLRRVPRGLAGRCHLSGGSGT